MSSAISDATGSGSINLIHVAILEVGKDTTWIIDATIKHGVDRHPLDTFLKDFTLKDGSMPVFIVKRLKDSRMAEQFVENAKRYLGRPYDVWFSPDNEAMYCSELVRDSYRTPDGGYLFDTQSIPQDEPGTNPQDMSQASVLITVPVCLPNPDLSDHS